MSFTVVEINGTSRTPSPTVEFLRMARTPFHTIDFYGTSRTPSPTVEFHRMARAPLITVWNE